ncbi:hypothetical protein F9U64_13980 [Gracilibacillus oryzae]|uniref:Beta-carotene 15,15'-monooxygenase n=1 Tax=Gracilibacillus oryzae TaxID=1672701 RepID=A0A7C8KT04_9BACI|nr:hypothetical protein [Gracilibacillus oryzae]KAB8130736.1 hypothetical protein F9U64_13980 [Gracilibacillus oryzae]
MVGTFPVNNIDWKRIIIFLLIILVPNYLVMQVQLVGPVDDLVGIGTAIDLVIILPLAIYFLGFKKRVSWLVLCAFIFWGLLLANWMIPNEADGYLTYFNYSVIMLEAAVILVEVILFIAIVRRMPRLIQSYHTEKKQHYHFLSSFSVAIVKTFTFKNKHINKFQLILRVFATDIAAIYYSLFSWRKKAPVADSGHTFTFHKDGGYQGVFFMLVHAMVLEVIAVHILVSQVSHVAAWILTFFDIFALLFIIADYQAIRLSPVVLDEKGLHFQKGIRQYGFITWEQISELRKNEKSPKETAKDRESISLALHGLEQEPIPYVIELNEPVEIRQLFGLKKIIRSIYFKMDQSHLFFETVTDYLAKRDLK